MRRSYVLLLTVFTDENPPYEGEAKELARYVEAIEDRNGDAGSVSIRSSLRKSRLADEISRCTAIAFLGMWDYHLYIDEVRSFIHDHLMDLRDKVVANPPEVVLWNMDKELYLTELSAAGFAIPSTQYISLPATSTQILETLQSRTDPTATVVLKPTISASAYLTHLIRDPSNLTAREQTEIQAYADIKGPAKLMLQEFIPEVSTGEISIVMIDGEIMHAVRKVPPVDEFRTNGEFGGSREQLRTDEIDQGAKKVATDAWNYVVNRFPASENESGGLVYARIDGVLRNDGSFVLIEIELVEPWMWLWGEIGAKALNRLCDRLMKVP